MTTVVDVIDVRDAATAPQPPSPPWSGGGAAGRVARSVGWSLVGAALFVAAWQAAASRSPSLPTPSEAFTTLRALLGDAFVQEGINGKGIAVQLGVSLVRVAKGFAAAVAVGVPIGLLMGSSRRVWLALNPLVQVLRPVSPLAWFPIWLVVSNDAAKASVVVIFLTALWPVVVNTAAGAADVPREQQNVARVFRFGRIAYLRHVLVPNALPSIVTGMRLSMGVAWMVIVAVEMLSGSVGIGFFVWDSYNAGRLDAVIAAIVLIGVIGVVLDVLFLKLSRRVAAEVRS